MAARRSSTDRQDFSGKTLDFKVHMTAGSHWIAGTVPRMYEGLPTKYNGPNPTKRPPPPPRGLQAAAERDAGTARAPAEVLRGAPEGDRAGRRAARQLRGDRRAVRSEERRVRGEPRARVHVRSRRDRREAHLATCPTKIVSSFARRAFRRPVDGRRDEDVRRRVRPGAQERRDVRRKHWLRAAGDSRLTGFPVPHRTRSSRDVTARATAGPPAAPMGHLINQHELATRLSYFLWASLPDAELRRVASNGTLRQPAVLQAQVQRMLKDPRSRVLAEEFGGQWLQFRALESLTRDRDKFPDFEDYLRLSMRRETELFIEHIVREDRPVTDFLDAPYTFVNERLARHYGIPNVSGPEFRRVDLTNTKRGGVLTQASVLTVSSYATRTSPVLRGKWILDNILGTPPPDPPADIPNLDEEKIGADMTGAPADGGAPQESDLFVVSSAHGSARLRPRELRRDRRLAHRGRQVPDRRDRPPARRARVRRSGGTSRDPQERSRGVHAHDRQQADDLCARPRPRALRPSRGEDDRGARSRRTTIASPASSWRSCRAVRSRCGAGRSNRSVRRPA